ncbi:hypothetical protein HK100_011719 [Physocladia obscura]|uniref:BZIP domain-containing protein n=1 Tax=Physocladia obscura TaxID=109957 RepID=A0AAD5T8Q1_9FUNG|nr:hypothetical protein HK100_011719 [Physocladia obscura]
MATASYSTSHSASPTPEQEGGNKVRRPGRKLTTDEAATKRIAQTRAAQRNFRERKARQFEALQERVQELESLLAASRHETEDLKVKVMELLQSNCNLMRDQAEVQSRNLHHSQHQHHQGRTNAALTSLPLAGSNGSSRMQSEESDGAAKHCTRYWDTVC